MLSPFRRSGAARYLKRPLVATLHRVNRALRRVTGATHAVQHYVEWGLPPLPEWYDHYLDLHWGWPRKGRGFFLERGVFGSLPIASDATVLELCCGDGFNARHFYGPRAARVLAVDFDDQAIAHARRHNAHERVEYMCADIRNEMPSGRFTNITLDAAIEHFSDDEIDDLLKAISERLTEAGVLSGYTVVARGDGLKHLDHHEREFIDKADLAQFLERAFPHVTVFETSYPERINLYFYAANSPASLPFDASNPGFLIAHRDADYAAET